MLMDFNIPLFKTSKDEEEESSAFKEVILHFADFEKR